MDRVEVSGAGAEEGSGEETEPEEESGMNLVEESGAAMTHGSGNA